MAVCPLRPATDLCLGGLLPHQLANRPRAPLSAHFCFPFSGLCGISRSFPRLSPTTGQVPTRYSPVRHSLAAETAKAFDLHVLGMPPAFVLSQDQTLKFIPDLLKGRNLLIGRPIQGPPNVRLNARTPSGPTAAVRASLPISPQSQTTCPQGPQTSKGAALIGPPVNHVNTRISVSRPRLLEPTTQAPSAACGARQLGSVRARA